MSGNLLWRFRYRFEDLPRYLESSWERIGILLCKKKKKEFPARVKNILNYGSTVFGSYAIVNIMI